MTKESKALYHLREAEKLLYNEYEGLEFQTDLMALIKQLEDEVKEQRK